MELNPGGSLNTNINKVEYKKVLELLEHYDITPDTVTSQKDVFIITSDTDTYCLKKVKNNRKNIVKNIQLSHHLIQCGFNNIPDFIKTKDGKDLLKTNKGFYYLSHWIVGRECNYSNFDDLKNIAVLLAGFHLKSQGYYNKHIEIEYKEYDWSSRLKKYKDVFSIVREIIRNRKIKTMFDILYLDSIEFFEDQLELSVKLLNQTNYNRILQNAQLKYTLCIDDFNLKNVIAGNDQEFYFTCLNNVKYNINLFDISKFIKKTLFKKEYAWEFKYARDIIDNYCIVNPLSKDELSILLSFIIFPKFFYKLGKRKYMKKKKWGEDKYLEKLYEATRHIDNQRRFVEEYLSYYSINN